MDLEVLLLRAEVLLGLVDLGLEGVDRLLGFGEGRLNRLDLLGQPRRLGLEGGNLRVVALQLDQGIEFCVHRVSTLVGPPGFEPRPDRL